MKKHDRHKAAQGLDVLLGSTDDLAEAFEATAEFEDVAACVLRAIGVLEKIEMQVAKLPLVSTAKPDLKPMLRTLREAHRALTTFQTERPGG